MKERAARKALSHLCRPEAKRGLRVILGKQWKCQKTGKAKQWKLKSKNEKVKVGNENDREKWKWILKWGMRKWDIDKWRRVGLEPSVLSWGKSKEAQIWRKKITWKDRTSIKTPIRRGSKYHVAVWKARVTLKNGMEEMVLIQRGKTIGSNFLILLSLFKAKAKILWLVFPFSSHCEKPLMERGQRKHKGWREAVL